MQTGMPHRAAVEVSERRKILLIAEEPSVRNLIVTFLNTMGCSCVVASGIELDTLFPPESFDAVLLDGDQPGTAAETALSKIKESRPGLLAKVLMLRSSTTSPQALELIERHNLHQVSEQNLPQHLWPALQGLFTISHSPQLLPQGMQAAQVTFDSARGPSPIAMRALRASPRQVVYQHRNATIDLLIEPREESGRIAITGQLLHDPKRTEESHGLPVLLVKGIKTVLRTSTNQLGEFCLECIPMQEACLEMRLGEANWVSLPLGELDWPTCRMVE